MVPRWSVLAALLAASAAQAAPYSCGPFLLQPGTDGMTVVIDHETPVAAELTYGRADGHGKRQTVTHRQAERHHRFELTGLEPGTEYRYRVATRNGPDSGERVFRALPAAPERFRLLALGDARTYPEVWHQVAQRIYEHEADALFIIGTGDYPADGSQYDQWVNQFFAPGRDLLSRVPLWPSIGNHERTRQYVTEPPPDYEERSHYFNLFELPGNERWFRVDYRYVTLLVLDSNSEMAPGHEQYGWLLEQLKSDRRRFTLAAFHHPPYTSGPHGRLLPDGTPREWPMDQGQRFLVPLFEVYGVDLVLNGHDHFYERSRKEGVTYVVTGGAGAPLYDPGSAPNPYRVVSAKGNHYLGMDVDNSSITVTAIAPDGEVMDWFTIPMSERTRQRRMGLAAARLGSAVECRAEEAAAGEVACGVTNPFGYDLTVAVTGGGEGVDIGGEQVLQVPGGGAAEVRVRLAGLQARLEQPAWRGRVEVPLSLRISGDDEGIPIAATQSQSVVLRDAGCTVRRMAPPAVDGDLGEWAGVPAMEIDAASLTVVNRELYAGDADLHATVRLGWSPAALHLAVEVFDDTLMDVTTREAWENDGVEVYLDGRPEAERTATYGTWVSQNVLPALRPVEGQLVGNNSWPADALDWKVRPFEGGYAVEASLPFERITGGATAQAGDLVRFDLMINDRDGADGGQSHHRLWSTGGASSNASGFGLLTLTE